MRRPFTYLSLFFLLTTLFCMAFKTNAQTRQRICINDSWRFFRYADGQETDSLIYDVRPEIETYNDNRQADEKPTEAVNAKAKGLILKLWIMPTGNAFIKDAAKKYQRPEGNPGSNFAFVRSNFDDKEWEIVDLPHDWAIKGPFYKGWGSTVGGGMGRLPSQGVAWYRKKIFIPQADNGKSVFFDIDGAMSYAMVWVNNKLVGGWPYGYASWRLDITPYLIYGADNQIAIRVDNPNNSSRWYPGGGIYRNVWLVKTNPVHIAQWGTYITPNNISIASARVNLNINVENSSDSDADVAVSVKIYNLDTIKKSHVKAMVAHVVSSTVKITHQSAIAISIKAVINNPKLWGPPPAQKPNRYIAIINIIQNGQLIDEYETTFGIRDIKYDVDKGVMINGKPVHLKGANQHHDLGALGAAFNVRAAERQLQLLKESGCNAIRMAHNPPAQELLELTDRMGILVIDEIFDCWELKKTPHDFHLIFPDWHEQDLRSFIRRDRNHPSVILWSIGNEVGEQYTNEKGAALARKMIQITKEEDTTRSVSLSMNYAKPGMPITSVPDMLNLNYQGEGIRNGGAYQGLKGITTPPLFLSFRQTYPDKMIISSENAATVSSRGEYFFPVFNTNSAPVKHGQGGDSIHQQVSSYDIYSVEFGSSPDKVFATMHEHPFVAGGFVWSGWDYIGEPTPYYLSRSSYFGIIDLAGFKKDRFYLYQSYWRPDYPMIHILPHWNWQERNGITTPVHIYTSGDEAELFLNGKSLGKKRKQPFEYRLRWDDVKYEKGELKAVAYKEGKKWAEDIIKTTGNAYKLELNADRKNFLADGNDLSFITVKVTDRSGLMVPTAKNSLKFFIEGPGEIVATDNGDAADLVSFASHERDAFNGLCLVIVRAKKSKAGTIRLTAKSDGLQTATITLKSVVKNKDQ